MIKFTKQQSQILFAYSEFARLHFGHFSRLYDPRDVPKRASYSRPSYREIESEDAFVVGRPPDHFGMAQGTDRVVIPSPPVPS